MLLLAYLTHVPRIGAGIDAHASAAVIGRATLGQGCALGPLAVLRADGEDIRIGDDCWFGEASTVHIAEGRCGSNVGSGVTVGRFGLVHACTIGDGCVIGEQSAVMDGSVVGPGAVIAAESVVPPGKNLEGGWLYAGAPARPVERVAAGRLAELHRAIRSRTEAAGPVTATAPVAALRHAVGTGTAQAFAPGVYVAPTASLAGRVELASRSSVWFGVEIDAGDASVSVGENTNVQDNSRLYAGGPGGDLRIGPDVLIGHNVRIFAATIEEGAIIGMGSVVSAGTRVRRGACVAAGSVTEPGSEIATGEIWSGRPARSSRPLSEANRLVFAYSVRKYVEYAANYLATANSAGALHR